MSALSLMVLLLPGIPQAAPKPLPSYETALRCVGLTQAASELEGGESGEGRRLYDAALYWSLTAMQMARTAARPSEAAETDQTRSRIAAVRALSADDRAARADLQRCRTDTPELG